MIVDVCWQLQARDKRFQVPTAKHQSCCAHQTRNKPVGFHRNSPSIRINTFLEIGGVRHEFYVSHRSTLPARVIATPRHYGTSSTRKATPVLSRASRLNSLVAFVVAHPDSTKPSLLDFDICIRQNIKTSCTRMYFGLHEHTCTSVARHSPPERHP